MEPSAQRSKIVWKFGFLFFLFLAGSIVPSLADEGNGKDIKNGNSDGARSRARFSSPSGLATDSAGNFYVADSVTIRRITPDGVVTTLAGGKGERGYRDGTGSQARFASPHYLAADGAGNVYVADADNQAIRKITPGGVVTTLAGGKGEKSHKNETGSQARFDHPRGLATDRAGNVYVADNTAIRKITPDGAVTTLAGKVGQEGYKDGTSSQARFSDLFGLATDGEGNVYVADYNAIRKITHGGVVTTLAGKVGQEGYKDATGSQARFSGANRLATDGEGNVYVQEQPLIRKITPDGVVTTLAGKKGQYGHKDGTGAQARFSFLVGLVTDGTGNIYVVDESTIRKITPDGVVTTWAGKP